MGWQLGNGYWQAQKCIRPDFFPRVLRWGGNRPMRADVPRLMSESIDRVVTMISCLTNSWFDHRQTYKLFSTSENEIQKTNTIAFWLTWKCGQVATLVCSSRYVNIFSLHEQPNVFMSLQSLRYIPICHTYAYVWPYMFTRTRNKSSVTLLKC